MPLRAVGTRRYFPFYCPSHLYTISCSLLVPITEAPAIKYQSQGDFSIKMNEETVPEGSLRSPTTTPSSEIELKLIEHGATSTSPTPKDNDPSQPNELPSQNLVCEFNPVSHISIQPASSQDNSPEHIKGTPKTEVVVQVCEDSAESSENIQQHSAVGRPQFEVILPTGSQNHIDPEDISRRLTLRGRVTKNVQKHYLSLLNWLMMLFFAIFLCYYFYEVLVVVDPQVGKLNPSPANTNFIVAVLAQVFGALMVVAYREILNLLHLHRLSRPRGALMLEGGQVSTNALGTARILFTPGRHHIWTLLRYVTVCLLAKMRD
jgi:hypothetical protein